jgi:uncharacterized RDD family membrane protein YckC
MGEVLMKHLTAQPRLDELPEPFGQVIRKALAKDPNQRYQTVSEMVAQITDGHGVRDSLAGFNPASLTQVAARVAEHVAVSPAPSPPPPPPPPRAAEPAFAVPYNPRLAAEARSLEAAPGPKPAAAALSPEAASGTLRYAGFWVRFVAALIDMIIVGAVSSVLIPRGDAYIPLAILYSGLLIGKWNGQTLGKKALGIKVISANGRPCGLGQAFGRAAAEVLSTVTLCFGYLMIAFDHQKRGLHDHLARTLHVYAIQ